MSAVRNIAVQPWSAPAIGSAAGAARGTGKPQDMHEGERRVWQEAEAAGRAAGLEAARVAIEARQQILDETTRKLESALQALSRPLAQLDDNVHSQIAMLATALTRACCRRELSTETTQIIGIGRTVACCGQCARCALTHRKTPLVRKFSVRPGQAGIVDDAVLRGDAGQTETRRSMPG